MKKKYKKKKIKTGVIAASAFGITATVVLAVVLLTTGIKEDTSKTDDILAGAEKIPEPSQSAALEQEPGESKSAEEETVPEEEAALTEGALEKAEAMEEEGAEEQERAPLLNIPAWTNTGSVNMRSGPNTESEILTVLGRNARLVLKYEEEGWGAVSFEGKEGYVSLDYLTREEPTANGLTVVIDPGHQRKGDSTPEPNGPDSSTMKARVTGGTSGRTTGVMEYELTLDISNMRVR